MGRALSSPPGGASGGGGDGGTSAWAVVAEAVDVLGAGPQPEHWILRRLMENHLSDTIPYIHRCGRGYPIIISDMCAIRRFCSDTKLSDIAKVAKL